MTEFASTTPVNPRTVEDPGYGRWTVREIAVVVALSAFALTVLPRTAHLHASVLMPVAYALGRDHTRLFIALSTVLIASAPALITGGRPDVVLRNATLLALTPLYLRLLKWSDDTGRWGLIDPLVISFTPISFVTLPALVVRLGHAWDPAAPFSLP